MIYNVKVEPEVARAIEVKAAEKGLTPEKFLEETIERVVEQSVASEAEVRRVAEQIRAKQAENDGGARR